MYKLIEWLKEYPTILTNNQRKGIISNIEYENALKLHNEIQKLYSQYLQSLPPEED